MYVIDEKEGASFIATRPPTYISIRRLPSILAHHVSARL